MCVCVCVFSWTFQPSKIWQQNEALEPLHRSVLSFIAKPKIRAMSVYTTSKAKWIVRNKSKNFPTNPWNIPQTPNQQFMKGFLSFGDVWGMLQGYVGFPLEQKNR